MHNKGNYTELFKENDLKNQGLIDFSEESKSNAEMSKLRLKTVENNLCKLKIKKIICTGYRRCFRLPFFHFMYLPM